MPLYNRDLMQRVFGRDVPLTIVLREMLEVRWGTFHQTEAVTSAADYARMLRILMHRGAGGREEAGGAAEQQIAEGVIMGEEEDGHSEEKSTFFDKIKVRAARGKERGKELEGDSNSHRLAQKCEDDAVESYINTEWSHLKSSSWDEEQLTNSDWQWVRLVEYHMHFGASERSHATHHFLFDVSGDGHAATAEDGAMEGGHAVQEDDERQEVATGAADEDGSNSVMRGPHHNNINSNLRHMVHMAYGVNDLTKNSLSYQSNQDIAPGKKQNYPSHLRSSSIQLQVVHALMAARHKRLGAKTVAPMRKVVLLEHIMRIIAAFADVPVVRSTHAWAAYPVGTAVTADLVMSSRQGAHEIHAVRPTKENAFQTSTTTVFLGRDPHAKRWTFARIQGNVGALGMEGKDEGDISYFVYNEIESDEAPNENIRLPDGTVVATVHRTYTQWRDDGETCMGEIHEWFDASHDIPVRILEKRIVGTKGSGQYRTISTTSTLDALTDEAVTLDESGETHSVRCARYVGDSETVDLLGYTTGGMTNIFNWLTCDIPGRVARRETTTLERQQSILQMSCTVPQVIAADSAKAQTIMKWVQAKIHDSAGESIETQREHQFAQLLEAYLELLEVHRTDGSKASLDEPNTAGSWGSMKAAYAEVRVLVHC